MQDAAQDCKTTKPRAKAHKKAQFENYVKNILSAIRFSYLWSCKLVKMCCHLNRGYRRIVVFYVAAWNIFSVKVNNCWHWQGYKCHIIKPLLSLTVITCSLTPAICIIYNKLGCGLSALCVSWVELHSGEGGMGEG